EALGAFVRALRGLDATDAPAPGRHNFGRGEPIRVRDAVTRSAIANLAGEIDAGTALKVWDEALAARDWDGPPTWLHGDLMPGNLIVAGGRLDAVIDFGGLAAGDPAVDLMPAWAVFEGPARDAFRDAAGLDAAAWWRGRAWALHAGVMALPYYRDSRPSFAAFARRMIEAAVGAD
ncbi:MAG TPA: phosphotransferase, partial [Caulobacteraceae bacterium]|nr:phosphotransferase [Caulobacteraceae bacterium]